MTATAHALVGGIIATTIQDPFVGITLSVASHPILDMVPHWDFGWGWRKKTKLKLFIQATLDLSFGFFLAYILFGRNIEFWYFALCVLAAELLDILEIPYWFLGWKFPPFGWLYKFQSNIQGKAKLPWGILTQVGTIAGLLILLRSIGLVFKV